MSDDPRRAIGEPNKARQTKGKNPMSYRIEHLRRLVIWNPPVWTSEGLGESENWATPDDAARAVRSLRDKGEEWIGRYRIVRERDGQVMRTIEIDGTRSTDPIVAADTDGERPASTPEDTTEEP